MKKLLLVMMALALIMSVSFANGGKESSSDENVSLDVYYYHDLSDQTAVAQWEEITSAWAEYSDIELNFEYQFNEPYHNKLQAMAVSGQIPDLLYLWPLKRTGYVTGAGLIKDLTPFMKGHEDEFAIAALSPQGPNGELYELPQQITATHVMYTNTKLLKELGLTYPKTFEELMAQGDKIRAAGYTPIAMDNGDGWQMQSCLLSALTERAGGMEWYDDVRTGKASFSDPEFVNALDVIQTLAEGDMFSPGMNSAGYGSALDDFVNGRAVYTIDGGWRVQSMIDEAPDEMKANIELNTFPTIPNQKGQADSTSVVAGTGFGMNANLSGAKADAAWEWIYFFSGPVGAKIRADNGMIPSCKIDMGDVDPLLAKLIEFLNTKPAGYVVDAVIDAEGMGILQPSLQEMMFGNQSSQAVADQFENWVAANDSTRNPK